MSGVRLACVQFRSGREPADNLAALEPLIRAAAADGARYVQTPEMTNLLERDREALYDKIVREDEDIFVARGAELAAELGIVLHFGSLAILREDGKAANRAFVFAPDGGILARYDKIHMFDVDLDHGESWRESETYAPGEVGVICDAGLFRMGLAICYDLRFPQLFRAYAHAEAQLLTAPAAFTRQTGEAHWHVLQRARAIENGAFMAAAAQGGHHEDGRETYGHSLIVGPWGEILAEAGDDAPGIVAATVDLEAVTAARKRIPALKNERRFALSRPA